MILYTYIGCSFCISLSPPSLWFWYQFPSPIPMYLWVFPYHQGILQHQLSINLIRHYLPGYGIKFPRLRAQSYKKPLSPTSDANCKSRLLPVLLTKYKSEVPMSPPPPAGPPPLGLINLVEQLPKLRNPVYSLDYQFITKSVKGYKSTDEQMQSVRSQTKELLPLWSWSLTGGTWENSGSPAWKLSETPRSGFLWRL